MRNSINVLLAILCVCCLMIGCNKGPKKVPITGTVTVAGETIDSGNITFDSVDGGPSDGAKIVDGKYEAEVTLGEKIVKVYGTKIVGQFEADPLANPGVMVNKYEDIPAKVFTEEIRVKIESKNQVVDVDYTGEGKKK